jgi:hypothetical protein
MLVHALLSCYRHLPSRVGVVVGRYDPGFWIGFEPRPAARWTISIRLNKQIAIAKSLSACWPILSGRRL